MYYYLTEDCITYEITPDKQWAFEYDPFKNERISNKPQKVLKPEKIVDTDTKNIIEFFEGYFKSLEK